MWIAHLNFGHKKLMAGLGFLVLGLLLSPRSPILWTLVIGLCVGILFLIYTLGIFVRKSRFTSKGKIFEVIDYYSLKQPLENKRILRHTQSGGVESSLYLHPQQRWSYFDIVRSAAEHIPPAKHTTALVLGGGGGTIGYLLTKNCGFARIEVVEHSQSMIQATKYFLPHQYRSVSYHHADAVSFVRQTQEKYMLVFADIFDGDNVDKQLFSAALLSRLPRLVLPGGVLILNVGYTPDALIKNIPRYIPGIPWCLWRGQLVGVWTRSDRQTAAIMKDQHALVIPSLSSQRTYI